MRRVSIAPRQPQLPGFDGEYKESVSQVTVSASEEAAESADKNGETEGHDSEGDSVSEESQSSKVAKEPKNGRKKK